MCLRAKWRVIKVICCTDKYAEITRVFLLVKPQTCIINKTKMLITVDKIDNQCVSTAALVANSHGSNIYRRFLMSS